ncbi:hypothetical protein N9035_00240, partial [Akkermansiaceae bacterium]|nr:hypothetical protein [Akkermansiaceae bacterium]
MSVIFVLIPLLAALLIFCGVKARLTALIASGLTLFLGLGTVFCYDAVIWSMSLQVLSVPNIHLALGFYDGMSVIMLLLSVIVLFTAILHGGAPEGREKLWYASSLI